MKTGLAEAINDALPQTQCTRCGFPDCSSYAQAIAEARADINQCPPGGAQGIARLAQLTGLAAQPLAAAHGSEGPRLVALIDEAACIGCTLCLKVCPVDSILGGPKAMHTVMINLCTGCELCVPACPVDCIALLPVTGCDTGWDAWSPAQAAQARQRYEAHRLRLERDERERSARLQARALDEADPPSPADAASGEAPPERKRAMIEAALQRARQRKT